MYDPYHPTIEYPSNQEQPYLTERHVPGASYIPIARPTTTILPRRRDLSAYASSRAIITGGAGGKGQRCRYPSKRCENRRAIKRNGELHTFCEFHREKANRNQRRLEQRKRLKKSRSHDESDHPGDSKSPTSPKDPVPFVVDSSSVSIQNMKIEDNNFTVFDTNGMSLSNIQHILTSWLDTMHLPPLISPSSSSSEHHYHPHHPHQSTGTDAWSMAAALVATATTGNNHSSSCIV